MKKILFLAVAVLACSSFTSCYKDRIRASGNVITETRNISDFEKVSVSHGIRAYVTMTDTPAGSLEVEADDNIQPYIDTYVRNGELIVEVKRNVIFKGNPTLKVYLEADELNKLAGSGGSQVDVQNKLATNTLRIEMSGGSRLVQLDAEANTINAALSGGSIANVDGSGAKLTLDASGGSKFNAYSLYVSEADINASGGSIVGISVDNKLKATASGGSRIRYKGNPSVVDKNESGGSSIENIE